ncbi:hypothetical protein DSECCO2_584820 [anaerobic digester metagenome]
MIIGVKSELSFRCQKCGERSRSAVLVESRSSPSKEVKIISFRNDGNHGIVKSQKTLLADIVSGEYVATDDPHITFFYISGKQPLKRRFGGHFNHVGVFDFAAGNRYKAGNLTISCKKKFADGNNILRI